MRTSRLTPYFLCLLAAPFLLELTRTLECLWIPSLIAMVLILLGPHHAMHRRGAMPRDYLVIGHFHWIGEFVCRGCGPSYAPKRQTVSFRDQLSRPMVVLLFSLLAGCASRPGPEVLEPVGRQTTGMKTVAVLAVSDRTRVGKDLQAGRGDLSYEQFKIALVPKQNSAGGASNQTRHREPMRDVLTVDRRQLDGRSFVSAVSEWRRKSDDDIVVFVHGYNYRHQEAVFRIAELAADSPNATIPILFSWPSEGSVAGYVADRDAAIYARDDLVGLLSTLTRMHSGQRIAVVAHSMGSWLTMEALRQLRLQGRSDVLRHLDVALAAPDIDLDVFRVQARSIGVLTPPLTVLASKDDRALAVSRRLAGGRTRLGAVDASDPSVVRFAREAGVRIVDISGLPTDDSFHHNRFVTAAALYSPPKDGLTEDLRQGGAFVLDATGSLLASPFNRTAQLINGSP